MTSVSTVAVGANMAAAGGAKARHGMNEAIARLSTGVRSMYGGDAGGASQAHQIRAEGRSAFMAARNAEDGISYLQTAESLLLEIATSTASARRLFSRCFLSSTIRSTTKFIVFELEIKSNGA